MKHILPFVFIIHSCGTVLAVKESDSQPVKQEAPLSSFVQSVMQTCKAKLSEGKASILSKQIARIAEERFSTRTHQEAFVLLVCIESRFDGAARSKVGAVGLTQVMPKYIPAFAKDCGLGTVEVQDASDNEVNLTIGACYFRQLLDKFDGNVTLSLAGYNSGPDSPTTKKMSALQMGHPETAGYVAAFSVLREKMDRSQQ